jgi:tetratricopeptide (TPR) repeat protein
VLNLRWNLWRLLMEFRQVDQARELGAAIVADLRQLGGPQDGTAAFAEIYTTAFLFANDPAHRLSFDAAEAIVLANREIVKQRGCRGIADADAWTDYLLGGLYAARHDFDRAEPLLRQALAHIAPLGDELTLIPYAPRALAWVWIVRGDHARGDAVLQAQLGLMTRRASPMAVRVRTSLAFSQSMQGRHGDALELLGPAAADPSVASADAIRDSRALEIALVRAGVLLGSGDASQALAALPAATALDSMAGADGGQRGEALCAAGRHGEGLEALAEYLARESAWRSPASPFLARTRAVQGLCALAAGGAQQAKALARQSRSAMPPSAAVSPYFKQPLDKLEGALGMASPAPVAQR